MDCKYRFTSNVTTYQGCQHLSLILKKPMHHLKSRPQEALDKGNSLWFLSKDLAEICHDTAHDPVVDPDPFSAHRCHHALKTTSDRWVWVQWRSLPEGAAEFTLILSSQGVIPHGVFLPTCLRLHPWGLQPGQLLCILLHGYLKKKLNDYCVFKKEHWSAMWGRTFTEFTTGHWDSSWLKRWLDLFLEGTAIDRY